MNINVRYAFTNFDELGALFRFCGMVASFSLIFVQICLNMWCAYVILEGIFEICCNVNKSD